ncbi:hypothetical protein [Herbidospora solisilvae]|nr:hypothetical protein [Herbidospora solisilvae]
MYPLWEIRKDDNGWTAVSSAKTLEAASLAGLAQQLAVETRP